ncbi:MAG: glycogen debranching enzyme family protein [Fibrobacteres bacterium]|nr:glycogen debranching enzyme family protein [Fibrobacterota bacterium]
MKELILTDPALRSFEALSSLEWLETNGKGGYSSSSVAMANTRKYHGLLVLPLKGKQEKYVLISSLEESLVVGSNEHWLSAHQYKGAVFPNGFSNLNRFSTTPVPTFIYNAGAVILKKEILMPDSEEAVMIRYTFVKNSGQAEIKIRPLIAYRNFHCLAKSNGYICGEKRKITGGFSMEPYADMPIMNIQCTHTMKFKGDENWFNNFEYQKEQERGFDCNEDLFSPTEISIPVSGNDEIILRFGIDNVTGKLSRHWQTSFDQRLLFEKTLSGLTESRKSLARSARQFITTTENGRKSVVAGYHWFLDWGRDAMIALPGLTLIHGSADDSLKVLEYFASYERNGLIPNFIHPTGDAAYNTVDASLWFSWAVQHYCKATDNFESLKPIIWPALKNILAAHMRGTENKIKMLENGLITAGDEQTQLTWMDAMAYGHAVTPRWGCAVEINALWYNMLMFMSELSAELGDSLSIPDSLRIRVKDSFMRIFWMDDRGYLADAVTPESRDLTIRPNQIFAASLPYTMLTKPQIKSVTDCVTNHLLTPFGLRTLSPADPRYRGRYAGCSDDRDSAYHNGTVWPWLMCHYGEAMLRSGTPMATEILRKWLNDFEKHLNEAGAGTVSEIFDGDFPHKPDGCIAQAWSVSEILRLHSILDTDDSIK